MIRYTETVIKQLLDKYMDGTTTLEEEDILAHYFQNQKVSEEWKDYQQLFQEIETMKPQSKRRWMGWGIAVAAVFAGILFMIPSGQKSTSPSPTLTAQTDTIRSMENRSLEPDTTSLQKVQNQPLLQKRKKGKKVLPSIHNDDKANILMAEADTEQEVIKVQLAAHGYIPVMQEDGSIIFIQEQTELLSYEE